MEPLPLCFVPSSFKHSFDNPASPWIKEQFPYQRKNVDYISYNLENCKHNINQGKEGKEKEWFMLTPNFFWLKLKPFIHSHPAHQILTTRQKTTLTKQQKIINNIKYLFYFIFLKKKDKKWKSNSSNSKPSKHKHSQSRAELS